MLVNMFLRKKNKKKSASKGSLHIEKKEGSSTEIPWLDEARGCIDSGSNCRTGPFHHSSLSKFRKGSRRVCPDRRPVLDAPAVYFPSDLTPCRHIRIKSQVSSLVIVNSDAPSDQDT